MKPAEPQEPASAVPEDALAAAQEHDLATRPYGSWRRVPDDQLRRLLEGAAPLIRASERERIAALAESAGAVTVTREPCGCDDESCKAVVRVHAQVPFADLIREQALPPREPR